MRRRQYLALSAVGGLTATTGCLRFTGGGRRSNAAVDTTELSFGVSYAPAEQRAAITFSGGPEIRAGDLTVETTTGTSTRWPALGSTSETPDDTLVAGSRAEIGPNVANWETPVPATGTIRVIYHGTEAPTIVESFTLGDGATDTRTREATDRQRDEATDGQDEEATDDRTAQSDATTVLAHDYDGDLTDSVNSVDGIAAESGLRFSRASGRSALELAGDGASDDGGYYDIPDAALSEHLAPGASFSVTLWVRPDQLEGWEMILNGDGLIIDLRGGELRIRWYQSGRSVYRRAVPAGEYLTSGEWSHIGAVVDAGREVRGFVDGTALAPTPVPDGFGFRPGAKSDALRLGFHPNADDGAFDSHYNGAVDTLRIDRGTLDEQTIAARSRTR